MNKNGVNPSLVLGLPERSGFLLPALTIWTALVIYFAARKEGKGLLEIAHLLDSKSLAPIIGLTLLAIYTIFILGHLIDLLSNGINERFLANKMGGYPHERIVPPKRTTDTFQKHLDRKKTVIYRFSFFFEGAKLLISSISLYTILRLLERHPKLINHPYIPETITILLSYSKIAMMTAVVFALPSMIVRYFPFGTRSTREHAIELAKEKFDHAIGISKILKAISEIWKVLAFCTLGPLIYSYDILDGLVAGMVRINTNIDEKTFEKAQQGFKKFTNIDYCALQNNDRFWLAYFLIQTKLPQLAGKIESSKKFANFCRNQSFSCFVAALIFSAVFSHDMPDHIGLFSRNDFATLSLLMLISAWLFHWKFLHHYYAFTKMIVRALSLIASTQAQNKGRTNQKKPKPAASAPVN